MTSARADTSTRHNTSAAAVGHGPSVIQGIKAGGFKWGSGARGLTFLSSFLCAFCYLNTTHIRCPSVWRAMAAEAITGSEPPKSHPNCSALCLGHSSKAGNRRTGTTFADVGIMASLNFHFINYHKSSSSSSKSVLRRCQFCCLHCLIFIRGLTLISNFSMCILGRIPASGFQARGKK